MSFFPLTKPISSAIFQISCFYLVGMELGRGTARGNSERRARAHEVTRPSRSRDGRPRQQTGRLWNADEFFFSLSLPLSRKSAEVPVICRLISSAHKRPWRKSEVYF